MTWEEFLQSVLIPGVISIAKRLLAAFVLLVVGVIIIRFIVKKLKNGRMSQRAERTVHHFTVSFVKISLYVLLAVLVVAILGVPIASIVAVIGSIGLAISLAIQGTLSNLASGIMILVFKPFREGDYIESGDVGGTVEELGIFYTTLCTPDNKKVVIPNGNVTSGVLTNYSAKSTRRVEIKLDMEYGTDIDFAKKIISSVLSRNDKILKEPEPFIRMTEMGDSAIIVTVRVWCEKDNFWKVKFDLTEDFYNSLEAEGIRVPYQQIDVHIKDKER